MPIDQNRKQCPICLAYLFEEDDVVHCPTCGAPHHRDCWQTVGRCGLEELHGTDKQYCATAKEEPQEEPQETPQGKVCPACGEKLDEGTRFCPFCGRPAEGDLFSPETYGAAFSQAGAIKKDSEIDEGVTVHDAAKAVAANPLRYITKFITLDKKRKNSWNWAAFLLPGPWFAFRKMYRQSFVACAIQIISTIMLIPMNTALASLPTPEQAKNYFELAAHYSGFYEQIGLLPLIFGIGSLIINLAVRIISAARADWIYKNHIISAVREIKNADRDKEEEISRKLSGVSFIGFLVAFAAIEFIPSIILMFI